MLALSYLRMPQELCKGRKQVVPGVPQLRALQGAQLRTIAEQGWQQQRNILGLCIHVDTMQQPSQAVSQHCPAPCMGRGIRQEACKTGRQALLQVLAVLALVHTQQLTTFNTRNTRQHLRIRTQAVLNEML